MSDTNRPDDALRHERDRLLELVIALGDLSARDDGTDRLMQAVVETVQRLTRCVGAVLEVADDDEMVYRAASGVVAGHVGLRLDRATSLSGLCVAERRVLQAVDTETDPRVNRAACRAIGARSMLVAPLLHGGQATGALKAVAAEPAAFDAIDVHALQLAAQFIAGVLARQMATDAHERLAQVMAQRALQDELTGLPNRAAWTAELERALGRAQRAGQPVAVMFLDLDRFKHINDTCGHAAGDAVLREFAHRLRATLRRSDFVARLAGDEFVVLLDRVTDLEGDPPRVARKIIAAMQAPLEFGDRKLSMTTSIGIAAQRGPALDASELMHCADEAMYAAKRDGRGGIRIGYC
ncbi:diguanylate cyclase domain-containing protein [Lysobacter xanthus]